MSSVVAERRWGGFKWFADWLHQKWGHKLFGNTFVDHVSEFETFAKRIACFANSHSSQPNFNVNNFRVAVILDCNNTKTPRPGGGPVGRGRGARRKDPLIQKSFYNGWLRAHGFKFETTEGPNGLTLRLVGPDSARHNDFWMLGVGSFNAHLAAAQMAQSARYQYIGYADSIYPNSSHLYRKHAAAANHPQKAKMDAEDEAMSSVRELVEHHYGELDLLFPYTKAQHGGGVVKIG
jgi:hypothetical protein